MEVGQRVAYSGHVGTIRWKGEANDSLEVGLRSKETHLGYIGRMDGMDAPGGSLPSPDAQDDGQSPPSSTSILGIEWDDPLLGSFQSTEHFVSRRLERLKSVRNELARVYRGTPLEEACTAGILVENYRPCSFILPEVDTGTSFADAIKERYLTDSEPTESIGSAEFVGRDQAVEFFSQVKNLYTVGLSGSNVGSVGDCSKLSFPRAKELYLSSCLLYRWSDVARILELFPRLELLDLSGNVLNGWPSGENDKYDHTDSSGGLREGHPAVTLDSSGEPLSTGPLVLHSGLETLILNRTGLPIRDAMRIATLFPSIRSISLAGNAYTSLEVEELPTGVTSLDLSSNYIWSWSQVLRLVAKMGSLKTLVLTDNALSNLASEGKTDLWAISRQWAVWNDGRMDDHYGMNGHNYHHYGPSCGQEDPPVHAESGVEEPTTPYSGIPFHSLEELHVGDNFIGDWETITSISAIFQNLRILRLKLYERERLSSLQNVHRQVIIAIFPNLKVLNGSEISEYERMNAERYYLTLGESPFFQATERRFGNSPTPRERLELLHGKREVHTSAPIHSTIQTLQICLIPDADSESFAKEPVHKRVPSRATVRDLKMLCSKLFGMDLTDIILVYNDGNMPICERMEDEEAEIRQYGITDGYQIRVQSRRVLRNGGMNGDQNA